MCVHMHMFAYLHVCVVSYLRATHVSAQPMRKGSPGGLVPARQLPGEGLGWSGGQSPDTCRRKVLCDGKRRMSPRREGSL